MIAENAQFGNNSESSDGTVDVTRDGHIAIVTINRPNKLNAMTLAMIRDFFSVTKELDDDPEIRSIVLTGAGERAFCAGGDLKQLLPAALDAGWDILNPDPTVRFLSNVFTPVVAAVRGLCVGAGFEILLGTDIRVAGHDSSFALAEATWGLIPGSGTNVRLPRQVPWAIAMDMLLTGQPVSAERAEQVGLINRVVDPDRVLETAVQIAQVIAINGPVAVRTAKEIAVRSASLTDGFALEHALNSRVLRSLDAHEGVSAFRDKRTPEFGNR
ncbi:MAG: enoyl-CoA hydratase/isomerase family protein [Rhodococcus sp.]|nr:enoyl-CoA hydratase/isomerase family protein [Rhodococcus sp. (in: high G+C Gram-positive bacteria)]